MKYLIQLGTETDIIREIPVRPAEPVKTSPSLTPDSVGVFGVQGLVITLVLSLGKPLIDKFFLAFNESAKNKASKEDKALDAQLKQTELLQSSFSDQQEFFQELVKESQVRSTAAITASTLQSTEILAVLSKSLVGIEAKVSSNSEFLSHIADVIKTGKPIRIIVEKINGAVEIKGEEIFPPDHTHLPNKSAKPKNLKPEQKYSADREEEH